MRSRISMAAWALCSLLMACHEPPRAATLAVLTDLSGITEPCGCTSRPLGGLDRIAGALDALRARGPLALGVVGNTFFTFVRPTGAMAAQEAQKAEVLVDVLAHLAPVALVPGADDCGSLRPGLDAYLATHPLALDPTPLSTRLTSLGGTQVGLVGAASSVTDAAARIQAAATDLRGRGAAVVVALAAVDPAALRRAGEQLTDVDVVVLTGADTAPPPQLIGSTLFVGAGSKGERLGLLRLEPRRGSRTRWQFYDGGASTALAATAQLARLEQEAARLAPGPARDARLARATGIRQQLAQPPPPPPASSYFDWTVQDIGLDVPPAEWATTALAHYNHSLCAPALAESAKRTCPPAPDADSRYVGNAACEACHQPAFAVYDRTQHARAWATLTRAGKDCDLTCVGCHTVGFERPGGFCRLGDAAPTFVNVGCESCHGPGSGHAAAPGDRARWASSFVAAPGVETCRGCHNPTHSDTFDFATYLPRVLGAGHGRGAAVSMPSGGP